MAIRLADYLNRLSWSQTDLAREAEISINTVRRALAERPIARYNAHKIVTALSKGTGQKIVLASIKDLHISSLKHAKKVDFPTHDIN